MIMKTLRIRREARKYKLHFRSRLMQCLLILTHRMTIGWVEEFVRDGEVVDGFKIC